MPGYFLHNGHWHSMADGKTAPKGAPIASHPHAAGIPTPAKHFSDAEWDHLKLPETNVNAGSHNAALAKLKAHSEAGDVTAILGSGFGSNTYGVKLTKVANSLLSQHGSHHTVTPGQKAGTHAAVAHPATPELSASTPLPPKAKATIDAGTPEFLEAVIATNAHNPHVVAHAQKVLAEKQVATAAPSDHAAKAAFHAEMKQKHFDAAAKATQTSSHAASKAHTEAAHAHKHAEWMNANHATTKGDVGLASSTAESLSKEANTTKWKAGVDSVSVSAAAADTGPKEGDTKPGVDGSTLVLKDGHWVKVAEAGPAIEIKKHPDGTPIKPEGSSFLSTNTDIENWIADGNVGMLEDAVTSLTDLSSVGAKTALAYAQAGIRYLGKKQAAPAAVAGHPADHKVKLDAIPWDKQYLPPENSNAKSHNTAVSKIKAMAYAGDTDGLLAFIAAKGAPKQTYAKKQVILASAAVAALEPDDAALAHVTGAASLALQGKPAYDHLAHTIGAHKMSSPYDKAIATKIAAQDWLAANPDGEPEMHEALAQHDLSHQAAVIGMTTAAPAKAAPALNPSTKVMLDDFAQAGEWDKVSKVANQSATPAAKAYAQSLMAKKPAEPARVGKPAAAASGTDWSFSEKDPAFSDAQTLSVELEQDGAGLVVAKTDDGGYQVIKVSQDGTLGDDYTDHATLTAALDEVVSVHGAAMPPLDALQKMDPGYKPAPASSQKVQIDAPLYVNKQPGHNKFWSVSTLGAVMKTNYGKIGTKGQVTEKVFASEKAAKNAAVKLMDEKKAKGYTYSGATTHEHDAPAGTAAPAQPAGPKDGDTKQGVNGTLIFKDGHWHKMLSQAEVDSALNGLGTGEAKIASFAAKSGDIDGIKTAYANTLLKIYNGKKLPKTKAAIQKMATAVGNGVNILAGVDKYWKPGNVTPSPAAKPAPAAPAATLPGVDSIDGWTKTGAQDGYNDGAFYTDGSGQQWYCKFSAGGEDVAKSEMLALKLYEAAGLATPHMKLVTKGGKVGTASKVIAGLKQDKALLQSGGAHAIHGGFAADAWLANWDTVGNNPAAGKGWDNIQFGPDGTAYRIDAGGALAHKGAGGKKSASEWGNTVVELKTLLDASINANTAKAFGKMTDADLKASVAKVLGVSDYTIQALVDEFGPGSPADKQALTLKLIARKKSIASQHADVVKKTEAKGAAQKVTKEKPDPTALKVDASLLPKQHDFMNWQSSGKPISDKPYVQQNIVDEQAILDFALKGNLVALKDYKFQPVDKLTGAPVGAPAPISQHPSAHVKSFYDSCVNFMEVLANPPEPLRTFSGTAVNTVAELSEHFSPFNYGKGVAHVPANQRLGFWIALGAVANPEIFKPKVVNKAITAVKKAAAYENWKKLPKTVKTFLSAVQGSGSANQPYRDGKDTDNSGQDCRQVLTDCFAHASEHDEGFTVHKWMSMPDTMIQQFLQNPEGLVFQNPGSMCTSRSATGTSGFGEHRVTIHYAKGAKGMDTFGSGSFAGEQEITTIPGARFMVLKREMVAGKGGYSKRLELEVLMLPPDPGYIANLGKTPTA